MSKILVFIPMYNCEKQITRVIDQFTSEVLNIVSEVIIVNNHSTDNSEEVAKSYIKNKNLQQFKVMKNTENYGLGGTHKTSFQYAIENNFDFAIVLHGDDQGDFQNILPYLKSGEYMDYDCFLGARFHPKSQLQGYSKFRTFGNIVYNFLFSIVCGKVLYDLGSGLNCYKVSILKNKFYSKFPDNLTFNYCMIMASCFYKHKIKFFPIVWREDDQISNVRLFSQAKKVLGLLFSFAFQRKKFIENTDHRSIPGVPTQYSFTQIN